MTAVDPFGRAIDYLRLSVTDRCNLRCLYCLPSGGIAAARAQDTLTDDELVRLVAVAVGQGVRKVRVTGGEPLVRPGLPALVARLAALSGLEDLSLSTNGLLLPRLARPLRDAGLRRVNVSLDTLRPERFSRITRLGRWEDARDGVEAALEAGFGPVKVNVVVMKGLNDDEIPAFVELARHRPLHVRFIELMPIGETGFFNRDRWLPMDEIRRRCGPLEPVAADDAPRGWGPAEYFRPAGSVGTVGFIGALSCRFCARCNRLRLTSRGRLMPCLASPLGKDLLAPLRAGASDGELARLFRDVVSMKPEHHDMDAALHRVRETFMCAVGG
jgi:cyclic pyranopterin phosphate synthase